MIRITIMNLTVMEWKWPEIQKADKYFSSLTTGKANERPWSRSCHLHNFITMDWFACTTVEKKNAFNFFVQTSIIAVKISSILHSNLCKLGQFHITLMTVWLTYSRHNRDYDHDHELDRHGMKVTWNSKSWQVTLIELIKPAKMTAIKKLPLAQFYNNWLICMYNCLRPQRLVFTDSRIYA